MVQRLGLQASLQGARVPSLVRKLRSHVPRGTRKKKKSRRIGHELVVTAATGNAGKDAMRITSSNTQSVLVLHPQIHPH